MKSTCRLCAPRPPAWRRSVPLLGSVGLLLGLGGAVGKPEPCAAGQPTADARVDASADTTQRSVESQPRVTVRPLGREGSTPPDRANRVDVGSGVEPAGPVSSGAGADSSTREADMVFTNTGGVELLSLPWADVLIADDVRTTTRCGCTLERYEFPVSGGGDGSGPGFTVSVALYDECPGYDGQVITGTQAVVALPDDGQHLISVDLSAGAVQVPRTVWLGMTFDRAGPGAIVGAMPDVGFSSDVYHLPFTPCTANFTGTSLYASFNATLYCKAEPGPGPVDGAVDVSLTAKLRWSSHHLVPTP